jgi:hypothetical protein
MKNQILYKYLPVFIVALLFAGCVIDEVNQPDEVAAGSSFVITLDARTTLTDSNPKYGFLAVFLPASFEIDSVAFSGSIGEGYFYEMNNDTASLWHQANSSGIGVGAVDLMEDLFGGQEGYVWRVFETEDPHATGAQAEHTHEIKIYAKAGNTTGEYGLSYVVSESALDFTDDSMWGDSFDNMITVVEGTSIDRNDDMVSTFNLLQNYPNPFNPSTQISYSIDNNSEVLLEIVDMSGRVVSTLVNTVQVAGNYNVVADMSHLPSGIYLYRLNVDGMSQVRKMALIK